MVFAFNYRNVKPNSTYIVYRKAFCRFLPMEYSESGTTKDGFPVFWFRFPDNVFDSPDRNPENSCYCRPHVAPCLLSGLADITPCYYSKNLFYYFILLNDYIVVLNPDFTVTVIYDECMERFLASF